MFSSVYFSTIFYCVIPLIAVFAFKFHISELSGYNKSVKHAIEKCQNEIRALEAEWAYLCAPKRVKRLAVEVLGMRPTELNQMVKADVHKS